MSSFRFTFDYLREQFSSAQQQGYQITTCEGFCQLQPQNRLNRILVNRVDVDFSVKKTEKIIDLFNQLDIKGTFFIRLHAPEYNPFSFENYRIIRKIIDTGHEIGYHSEVIDESAIWKEEAIDCLKRDLDVLNRMFNISVKGVASHGGMTGLNNLDFWKAHKPAEFGLLYEAYDKEPEFNLFQESFYVSDSEWTRWKCYDKGNPVPGDTRSISEHAKDHHPILYTLIHPDTYFERHFYE